MLKDAIPQLTQELNSIQQDFKTVAETQQTEGAEGDEQAVAGKQ